MEMEHFKLDQWMFTDNLSISVKSGQEMRKNES